MSKLIHTDYQIKYVNLKTFCVTYFPDSAPSSLSFKMCT